MREIVQASGHVTTGTLHCLHLHMAALSPTRNNSRGWPQARDHSAHRPARAATVLPWLRAYTTPIVVSGDGELNLRPLDHCRPSGLHVSLADMLYAGVFVYPFVSHHLRYNSGLMSVNYRPLL